jgi:hypothetical protein
MDHSLRSTSILNISFLFFSLMAQPAQSQYEKQDDELTLAEGTLVSVRTTSDIPSKTGTGADLDLKVDDDVILKGHIVIKKGSPVKASVINGEKTGAGHKSGPLGIQFESTQTVDGQPVRLRAVKLSNGSDTSLSIAAFTVVSGLLLLPEGSEAGIAAGTRLAACVAEDKYFRIDESALVAIFPAAKVAAAARKAAAGPGSEGLATVYVYRPQTWVGKLREFSVICDGIEVARMVNGSYFSLKLEPGKHLLHMADLNHGYVIDMEPGQIYFFRVGLVTWKAEDQLILEDAQQALSEIRKLKFLKPDRVKDHRRVIEFQLPEIAP